jgi:uncharacterized cupredoxin-like copper-binding protein
MTDIMRGQKGFDTNQRALSGHAYNNFMVGMPFIQRNKEMIITRRAAVAGLVGSVAGLAINPAFAADTIVNVSLWDKGDSSMDMMGTAKPMGMAMMGANMSMVTMGITPDVTSVPAGEITFKATNDSTGIIHEMILAPVTDPAKPLPYDKDLERVDEEAAKSLGEVSELEPGSSGALTVTLKPGTYILYCNIPGHYMLGMWSLITVTA